MANLPPRDRPISTSFPDSTEGGIDVWAIRVFRDQTRQKLFFHQISGLHIADWPPCELRDYHFPEADAHVVVDDGLILEPYDGDDKSERRLATLLWR
jgi:hypothetical protein